MNTTEPRRELAPTLQGRYRLVRTLEESKRGTTFLGYDLRLHRWRAISVPVDETSSRRLFLEAEILAKLEHPALERVVDIGEDGPIMFVVRDRLHGTASSHLPMRPALAAFVVQRLADGLAHAHGRGILHGHLRPSVVRFSDDGSPVLTGFADAPRIDVTATGRMAEGWAHIAPEVRERARPDVRAEIYSLGAMLYTLVAGRHQPDLGFAEAYEGLLAPIPGPLRPVILRTCAHEPAQRPADADAFRALLGAAMDRLGSLGDLPWRPDPLPDQPPEYIVPDPAIQVIISVLGGPPSTARAVPVPDEVNSTIDSEGRIAYTMPEVYRKDPGFRDPFEKIDPRDRPSYVDPSHTPELLVRRPVRFTVTGQGSTVGEPRRASRSSGSGAQGPWMLLIATAAAAGSAFLVAAIGIFAFQMWEIQSDRAFVDAIMAERTAAEALVDASADPDRVEEAWFRLVDQPSAENAAAYVKLAAPAGDAVTTPTEARNALQRMKEALAEWEGR